MTKEFGRASIRKHKSGKSWAWQGVVYFTEDGMSHSTSKMLGIECDPPKKGEVKNGVNTTPKGKGARQALQKLSEWRNELIAKDQLDESGVASDKSSLLVPDYMDYYWSTRTGIAASTRSGYRSLRKHLDKPELAKKVSSLTSDDVESWLAAGRRKGVSENTLRKAFDQLRYALDYARDMGHIKRNPCTPVGKPERSHRDPNPLSSNSLGKLMPMLKDIRDMDLSSRVLSDAAMLAIYTGMREGEIAGLRWDDIDGGPEGKIGSGEFIHVNGIIETVDGPKWRPNTKTHRTRKVPLSRQTKELLLRIWHEVAKDDNDNLSGCYVISYLHTPQQFMRPDRLGKEWAKFIKYSGILGEEGLTPTFHDLRHTFATQALQANVPVLIVSGILGHENPTTTLRHYAKWIPDQSQEQMAKVNDTLEQIGQGKKDDKKDE